MESDGLKQLRRIVLEEAIKASTGYMRKEKVREDIQAMVQSRIASGDVSSEEELRDLFKTVDMAVAALRAVPFEAFVKVSEKSKK